MTPDLSTATVSSLIGNIYDCALAPELWPSVLNDLRSALGFEHATISLQSLPSGDVRLNMTSGIPSPWLERIDDYGADILALWGGTDVIASAPLEEPLLLSRLNPEVATGTSRNRYYREWREPQGLTDTIAIGLVRDSRSFGAASLVRHCDQGPVSEDDLTLARLFAPHLRRAVTISHLLDVQTIATVRFQRTLDAIAAPVMLVDADLRVCHANAAGRAMLETGLPLAMHAGFLVAPSPMVRAALVRTTTQAVNDEGAMGSLGLSIPAITAEGALCALHLLPLARGPLRTGLMPGAVIAIFIAIPGRSSLNIGEMLAEYFGLTQAELRVVEQITAGLTIAEAAGTLRVNISTVRTHLLRVFAKVGVRRQSDLIRMVRDLATLAINPGCDTHRT